VKNWEGTHKYEEGRGSREEQVFMLEVSALVVSGLAGLRSQREIGFLGQV